MKGIVSCTFIFLKENYLYIDFSKVDLSLRVENIK